MNGTEDKLDREAITIEGETVRCIGISPRGNFFAMPKSEDGSHWLANETFELSPIQIREWIS